ncbi:ankyrin repeat protein [Purpureocillium lavendulum]|uniref:Ankyrin repeat protein n=1 Tax=Purpureocillium lavendulum TaxID=1247861 RepID=A0AB34G555_9HYPO|nr:ankyrin repeat protein [Purpureocillium lavendulum]
MDAQNAAESDQTRTAGASSPRQRRGSESDKKARSPTAVRAASPIRDAKLKAARAPATAAAAAAAPSSAATDDASSTVRPDDSHEDRDSDAETIVLPGKDGHSPSKARKVRQEDKSESDGDASKNKNKASKQRPDDKEKAKEPSNGSSNDTGKHAAGSVGAGAPGSHVANDVNKRKRRPSASGSAGAPETDRRPRNKEGGSSGLSSAPASPPQTYHHQHPPRRHRSDAALSSPSDSEQQSHSKASSKTSLRDKLKSGERLVPHKRKAPKVESDDEADSRKARRQRTTSAGLESGRPAKTPSKPHDDTRTRSISPHPRQHRRSISTQLPPQSSGGLHTKKKRLPPPLHATDYHSDDSSAGGTPQPRSSKLRGLAAPSTSESNISPARMGPHKKHLDAHGQTLLARACARGEYESAKTRLTERPEDLNVADYAGNTPLQIAAINGCEDIVKLLIDAGCNLDCVNYDKDTPLLDAVDNGHLGVVKLLLDAGVNPRKANVNGEEPIDRVTDETENADEIRNALTEARKRSGGKRSRTSEDRQSHDNQDFAAESPRHSPAAPGSLPGRRSGTVRSTKTRNDLLYMPLDDKTLRQAAGRGDEETVARILQVKEGYDDPEAMVAAARGGHDLVIQLLLGLGGANPDPGPVASLQEELATPILAAIGQENIKVVELLLEQQRFDPTRRFKGETYYEIAKRRRGPHWRDEEHKLKNAYDEYKRSHRDGAKTKSPTAHRDRKREPRRDEAKDATRALKRNQPSPSREGETKKKAPTARLTSPQEKRRSNSFTNRPDDETQKRAATRAKKDSSTVSDREVSPALSHKPQKAKRAESDMTGMSSEGEAAKPRRKLISKGELSRERDKHKRFKEPASPHDSKADDGPDRSKLSEKYHDRTKALKRDESRDHASSDGATKRHRASVTPDRPSDHDKDTSDGPTKRRRLDGENPEKRSKRVASPDGRQRKSSSSRDASSKPPKKEREEGPGLLKDRRDSNNLGSGRNSGVGPSIHVKSEDVDVPMLDIEQPEDTAMADAARERNEQLKKKKEQEEQAAAEEAKKQEERKRVEAEEKKKREAEEKKREAEEKKKREAEEARKREEEEKARKAEEEKRQREEEEERKRQEQAERERREADEAARREAEEKKRLEEEEKKKEEEERRQREEAERLQREQLEREAAERARKEREEEERKEWERRERAHREEVERKRAAREAEQRRIHEEQERARLDKLPALLRWLQLCQNPTAPAITKLFSNIQGWRYDTIRPDTDNTAEGREQWVLNTEVALLLGEKDLALSRYTAWERVPATKVAKMSILKTELGRPRKMGPMLRKLESDAKERFLAMDLFFVKVNDLLYTVRNIPHLANVEIGVEYRELCESEQEVNQFVKTKWKWRDDPTMAHYGRHAPRFKYYINGVFVREQLPTTNPMRREPWPEVRVPRRGLVQVLPEDPDYERICKEQGIEPRVTGRQTPSLPNGVHSSPISQTSTASAQQPLVNGTNGHSSNEPVQAPKILSEDSKPNGVHET